MQGDKIEKFMTLAGQQLAQKVEYGTEAQRRLGAQLLLSEVLEYVIKGLGVIPEINGKPLTDPEAVTYTNSPTRSPAAVEMLDGLADVAYTMYWNAIAFGLPLEEGFDLVCDNNLEKFVKLDGWARGSLVVDNSEWDLGRNIRWPAEVAKVEIIQVGAEFYAVGKDARGKVRKPSSYSSVDLSRLVSEPMAVAANG